MPIDYRLLYPDGAAVDKLYLQNVRVYISLLNMPPLFWQSGDMKSRFAVLLAGGVCWGLTGCSTLEPGGPVRQEALQSYFSRAQDPRRYWLTVYPSDQGAVFANANRVHPDQIFEMRFEGDQKELRPVFKALTHGFTEFKVLFDTTAPVSWMTLSPAVKLGLVPLGPPAYPATAAHIAEETQGYAGVLEKLILDQLHMENTIFFVKTSDQSFGALARGAGAPRPEAVIGCNILRSLSFVQFDYPRKRVVLSSTIPYKPGAQVAGQAPYAPQQDAFSIQGRLNGKKTVFTLDVAGGYEIALPDAPEGPVEIDAGGAKLTPATYVDRAAEGLAPAHRISLGRYLLKEYKVTLDNQKRVVYFEKSTRSSGSK